MQIIGVILLVTILTAPLIRSFLTLGVVAHTLEDMGEDKGDYIQSPDGTKITVAFDATKMFQFTVTFKRNDEEFKLPVFHKVKSIPTQFEKIVLDFESKFNHRENEDRPAIMMVMAMFGIFVSPIIATIIMMVL